MSCDLDGDGRVALITGAAAGLGRATAEAFAIAGYRLALVDVDAEGLAGLAGELAPSGAKVCCFCADVTSPAQLDAAFAGAASAWGGIDFVFHAAGILGRAALIDEADDGDLAKVAAVDLMGTIYVCKRAVRALKQRNGGAILAVASIAAEAGSASHPAYCAAKGGVVALTRSIARACGRFNVRINCVCPGSILGTNLGSSLHDRPLTAEERQRLAIGLMRSIPLGRAAQPRDVANLALYLASPLARHIHGAVLTIDGGESLRVESPVREGRESEPFASPPLRRHAPPAKPEGVSHGEPRS
jgi:NAD(P)-dependent dehydrogenase (short-subunit alcohol dehydrogenase family)